jgi:hypothetical protein
VHLKIEDIDGTANGGYFYSQEIDVKFTAKDLVRKGRGNKRGDKFVKKLNIKLDTEEIILLYGVPSAPFEP